MIARIMISLLITQLAVAESMDDIYQETIRSGADLTALSQEIVLNHVASPVDPDDPRFVDSENLTDPESSKKYALEHESVQKQVTAAQSLHDSLESPDSALLSSAKDIQEHPQQHIPAGAYCQDGSCATIDSANHKDSMIPVTAILNDVLGGGASYDTSTEFSIYGGKSLTCRAGDSLGVTADCCKEKGLWLNLHIQSCNDTENELADAKELGLCHDVGKFTKTSNFVRFYHRTYCCFPTKIARVTQEQAKKTNQQGLEWGRPKYPNCKGFTDTQFALLDFGIMDLSEIESDIRNNIAYPDPQEMLEKPIEYMEEQGIASW
jgi:hypothetical protein